MVKVAAQKRISQPTERTMTPEKSLIGKLIAKHPRSRRKRAKKECEGFGRSAKGWTLLIDLDGT